MQQKLQLAKLPKNGLLDGP